MTLPPLEILFYGFSAITIVILVLIIAIERRVKKLLLGKNSLNLEDTIHHLAKEVKELKTFKEEATSYLGKVETRLTRSIQGVDTVRFNPFKGTGSGGNQSFSTALLDERGDGVVISSLYARDRVSTFAKPLNKFNSSYELTEEEHESIAKARAKVVKL